MSEETPESITIPLDGLQLIEASAGTGKTHLIVSLYLRVLAVLAVPVEAVLVLSYTVASTAELRLRVQRRLLHAAEVAAGRQPADAELAAILAEAGRTRGEAPAVLAARLSTAARRLDRARIQTIHGWARTVAAEEALALGLPLAAQFAEDDAVQARQALADAWRSALTEPAVSSESPSRTQALAAIAGPEALWGAAAGALCAPDDPSLLSPASDGLPVLASGADASLPGEGAALLLAEARTRLSLRRARSGRYGVDASLARLTSRLAQPGGQALAQRLSARHPVVLIDEFQDADARQYAIFRALLAAGGRALLLVGDPKQAIYGFRGGDVDNYLAARAEATRHRLRRNWRARPSLLAGLNALYAAAGTRAFDAGDPPSGIRHEPLLPAGNIEDAALRLERPALLPAALCFAHLPGAPRVIADRAQGELLVARHAAALVADWRAAAAAGELRAEGQPPSIAVLAENHAQLDLLAAALTAQGVPVRRRAPRSPADAREAVWLGLWLAALVDPQPARCRALWASPLYGLSLTALAATEVDPQARAELAASADRLQREGLPALLMTRLRATPATLQAASARRLQHLVEQLCWRSDPCDATALLGALVELRGDASRREALTVDVDHAVSLLTVHAAKGLEFDLVLLPFASARSRGHAPGAPPVAAELRRQREERLRTLYVALTRARLGLVIGLDLLGSRNELPALYHLLGADELGGSPPRRARLAVEALAAPAQLALLAWPAVGEVAFAAASPAALPAVAPPPRPSPPRPAPQLASYSSLLQATPRDTGSTSAGGVPELAGAGFGSAVHAVLEHADFAAWAGEGPLPAAEAQRVDAILARLPSLDAPAARRHAVERQVRAALNARLPEDLRLCELPAADRRAELPFTLRLRSPSDAAGTLAAMALQLRPAGVSGAALAPADASVGWLTGIIDLVYRHAGRWYLIDWKTNQLPLAEAATPALLAQAAADSGYELQMLIYAVALDRWLAARLPGYRREAHFGGVRWLYLRGMSRDAGSGILAPALPATLLDAASVLFGPA